MKIVNQKNNELIQEQNITHVPTVEFNDVVVYHEMADQTSVRLNLIDQVHSQLNQLEVMIQRREFVMKEIFHYIGE